MAMICPHCSSVMNTRTSRQISPLCKESYYECSNLHCGHIALGATELLRSVVAPNFPNPKVSLPIVKPDDPRDPRRKSDEQPELF